jgi:hypothetical protein
MKSEILTRPFLTALTALVSLVLVLVFGLCKTAGKPVPKVLDAEDSRNIRD